MIVVLVLLAAAAVLGQRPGSSNSEPLCQYSKFPPSDAIFFSLFLDMTGEDLMCEPFLMSLAGEINVDMDQLAVTNVTLRPLRLNLYCTQKSGTGEGDFTSLCSVAVDKLMNTLRAKDGTEPLKLQYTVRSAIAPSGELVANWRLQFQMPLWAPVVTVVGLLFVGGLLLFVLLFVLPSTGAGNPKF